MPICPKCHEENPQLGAKCPRDGHFFIPRESLEDAKRDPMIGTVAADKYVILGLISEGGMGAVYRALQLPVEREVALKVLRTELQDSDQGRDRFILEARAVSRLNHPNIITLHDFGFDSSNHPYMVMEYAPGKSLARWLRDDIDIDRIVHIMDQVLSALSEAHDRGIVHRDLKPENMIITKAGTDTDYVKLLDFGIARLINEGSTRKLTREGEVFGTPHYMAPEQAQGRRNVGPPADVYACGIILWELICGKCPFDAPTPLAVLFMHINEDLPPLDPREGMEVPHEIRAVIAKATKKEALSRYQHAGEMLEALRKAVNKAIGRVSLSGSTAAGRQPATEPDEPEPKQAASRSKPEPKRTNPDKPINLSSRAASDESDSHVAVFDPDPSLERPALSRTETNSDKKTAPKVTTLAKGDQGAKLKLSLVALSILGVFAVVVVIVALADSGDAPEAEASEAVEEVVDETDDTTSEDSKTEVASKTEKEPDEAVEPEKVEPAEDVDVEPGKTIPTSGTKALDPRTVAGHAPPNLDGSTVIAPPSAEPSKAVEKSSDPPETSGDTRPKSTTKTESSKKANSTATRKPAKDTQKVEDEEPQPEEEPKKVDEPKKFEPKTFTDPPPTKWK